MKLQILKLGEGVKRAGSDCADGSRAQVPVDHKIIRYAHHQKLKPTHRLTSVVAAVNRPFWRLVIGLLLRVLCELAVSHAVSKPQKTNRFTSFVR